MFKFLSENMMLKLIHHKLRETINLYLDRFSQKSYSQEGEDMLLGRIFENKKNGFYVDVGAHHPMRFSNTYRFYKKGWVGINIDAMPNSMKLFDKVRSRDINLEIPISNNQKVLTYYIFNEPALNGFSYELSLARDGVNGYKIISKKNMETKTLAAVLDMYLPKGQHIDFLSIDVEGLDFTVLQSNNWDKYRPEFVLVEILGERLDDIGKTEIAAYMKHKGYTIFAKTFYTVFFKQETNFQG